MRRRFRLLSVLLAFVFLVTMVPPVGAATPAVDQPLTMDEAISLLQLHGIVKGDERGNLNLYSYITRAEASAIFVRARKMSALAAQMADQVPFSDARGQWFSGEVAMAYQLGLMKGDPDGRFRPNDQITYAEFLTVLLRMIGQEPTGIWDPATIMWKAAEVGILPSNVTSSQPAVRQYAFWALASAMTVPLANGRTLLQDFDMVPPDLRLASVDSETTAESVKLTGTASGAYRVLVNGKQATLESRTGVFEAQVDLQMGTNDFTVQAYDRAGNVAQKTVSILRKPKVSTIEIEGPALIKPNTSVKLSIKAYDDKGKEVALKDATYTLSNKNHQFDQKTSTLKTGTQRGKATLTVTAGSVKGTYEFEVAGPSDKVKALRIEPINEGRAPAPDKEYEVRVVAVDEAGNVVTEDYGRKITLKADSRFVTISPKEAATEAGAATFTFEADREDYFYLTASSDDLDSAELWVEILDSPRIMLVATKSELEPGESTRIRAVLMNDKGRELKNDDDPIVIELEDVKGYGYFTDTDDEWIELTIDEDESTSERVTYRFQDGKGPIEIVGRVVSGPDYPVQTLFLTVDKPELAGDEFELSAPRTLRTGRTGDVVVRVLDSRGKVVEKGSYAFQIRMWVDGERVQDARDAIKAGVYLLFEEDYNQFRKDKYDWDESDIEAVSPVFTVARTIDGEANLTLFVMSDSDVEEVRIQVIGVSRSTKAYHPDGKGTGEDSLDLYEAEVKVNIY